jgi:hypothetical protein
VVAIGAALVYAGIPALRPYRPILSEARGHGKLRSSVYDAAAIPGAAMAFEEGTIGHACSGLGWTPGNYACFAIRDACLTFSGNGLERAVIRLTAEV